MLTEQEYQAAADALYKAEVDGELANPIAWLACKYKHAARGKWVFHIKNEP